MFAFRLCIKTWKLGQASYTVELGDKELFGHPKIVP